MSITNGNGQSKLRSFADNTFALIFARFVMPLMVSGIGVLLVMLLHDIDNSIIDVKQANKEAWAAITELNKKAVEMASVHGYGERGVPPEQTQQPEHDLPSIVRRGPAMRGSPVRA